MSINLFNPSGLTAPVVTTLQSSGGLLVSIDSSTGDIARTTTGFMEDEKYGVYFLTTTGTASGELDTAVTRTGTKTVKISTTNATGNSYALLGIASNFASTTVSSRSKYGIPCKPSTKYKLSCWVKTNNVATNSVSLTFGKYTAAGVFTFVLTPKLSGTNDWTLLTVENTTGASDTTLAIGLSNEIAGNVSDAWFDINSMTLEEVVEPVANSLTSSSPSIVSFTAVGSTDNIDQSQTTDNGGSAVGNFGGLQYMNSQSFTATKSKHTGVYLYKRPTTGTPTGNYKVDLRTDNAGNPSTTILATYTIPLATYNALTTSAEFLVKLPANITAGTLYHYVISNTATEALGNYFNVGNNSAGGYTGGYQRFSTDGGTTWAIGGTADLRFKSLYYKPTTNFKASQNNSTMQISADEDGFLNGSVINLVTGTATFTETFGTFYLLQYTISGSDLIAEINLPGVGLSASFTSDRTLNYSSDGVTYGATFPTGFSKVWVKILAYSGFASFSYSIQFSTSGINVLRNYPTNKDIIKQYSTTLGSATTSATYRATKWGFPAVEYSATEYQFLDVDTTATGSTVAFSELGTSYTTVADGASLAITSTSTPSVWVKTNITANRIYISSNDYNASSDKDGSLKQSVTYQVKENPISSRNTSISQHGRNVMKLTYG